TGSGVPKNHEEAAKWFLKAAQQGDADAQCQLGKMYAKGKGVKLDQVEAWKWFQLAEEQDHPHAQEGRLIIEHQLSPAQQLEALRRVDAFHGKTGIVLPGAPTATAEKRG
ncbi:MAG: tetratricopeptide repeat protein, partial [Verrucomicrobiota bacterium]